MLKSNNYALSKSWSVCCTVILRYTMFILDYHCFFACAFGNHKFYLVKTSRNKFHLKATKSILENVSIQTLLNLVCKMKYLF